MIFAVIAALMVFGGTTWLAQDLAVAGRPALRRLVAIGLVASLAAVVAALTAAALLTP